MLYKRANKHHEYIDQTSTESCRLNHYKHIVINIQSSTEHCYLHIREDIQFSVKSLYITATPKSLLMLHQNHHDHNLQCGHPHT